MLLKRDLGIGGEARRIGIQRLQESFNLCANLFIARHTALTVPVRFLGFHRNHPEGPEPAA